MTPAQRTNLQNLRRTLDRMDKVIDCHFVNRVGYGDMIDLTAHMRDLIKQVESDEDRR